MLLLGILGGDRERERAAGGGAGGAVTTKCVAADTLTLSELLPAIEW